MRTNAVDPAINGWLSSTAKHCWDVTGEEGAEALAVDELTACSGTMVIVGTETAAAAAVPFAARGSKTLDTQSIA